MKYAIIVAGGSGTRFGGNTPKQFLSLAGIPILMQSINKFIDADASTHITVVLPKSQVDTWKNLCSEYDFTVKHNIVLGGTSRFESVKNALNSLSANQDDLIAIHDGVRPLVSAQIINTAYQTASQTLSAIPAICVTDSIRTILSDGSSSPLLRSSLRAVQTPQTFNAGLLKKAYNVPFNTEFTDDASVVEKFGHKITLIEGSPNNIKITHPIDLIIAEEILKNG